MVKLTNDDEYLAIDKDFVESYLKTKSTDCILYSEDGDEFKIHKEVLGQTKLMRDILKSAANCCNIIEIFCPCPKNELEYVIEFLYTGNITCDEDTDMVEILNNLTDLFGFPLNLTENIDKDFKKSKNKEEYEIEELNSEEFEESFTDLNKISNIKADNSISNKPEFELNSELTLDMDLEKCAGFTNLLEAKKPKLTVKQRKNTKWNEMKEKNKGAHEAKKLFQCDICNSSYEAKHNLKRHFNDFHVETRAFVCKICGSSFKTKHHLKQHTSSVHDEKCHSNLTTIGGPWYFW